MRITVAAVGQSRQAAPEQGLAEDYRKRAVALGAKLGFSKLDFITVATSRTASSAARMDEEAKKLTARIPSAAHCVVLDEKGRSLSSEAFAQHLATLRDRGIRDVRRGVRLDGSRHDVEVDGRRLIVKGEGRDDREDDSGSVLVRELRYGAFRRAFWLPEGVTADDVHATYDKGLLSVRVKGANAVGDGPRKVAIESTEPAALETTDTD